MDKALSGMKNFYSPIVPAPASEDFDDEMNRLITLNPEDITQSILGRISVQECSLQIFMKTVFAMCLSVNHGSIIKTLYGNRMSVDLKP